MAKVCIIGGGPSGVYCALKLMMFSPDVDITIFDRSKMLLTLLPTGNGRCNLSYEEYDNRELASFFPRGEKFLYSVFAGYGVKETISDFEKIGVETYVQEDKRIFPKENKASFVRKKLLSAISKANFIQKEVNELPDNFDYYVISTGLKSGVMPVLEKIGHKIVPVKPSLCGLKIKEKNFLRLKGVSFNGVVFTDEGVSGPYIYKLSSFRAYDNFPYEIKIPLADIEKLKERIKECPKKLLKTVLGEFIPKSLAEVLINSDIQCANTSNKMIEGLEYLRLTATANDSRGEIIHAGGVSLNEIDKNFKSKIKDNLWIIGETLDVDGLTGGFNLQFCWSSASIAAENIVKSINS